MLAALTSPLQHSTSPPSIPISSPTLAPSADPSSSSQSSSSSSVDIASCVAPVARKRPPVVTVNTLNCKYDVVRECCVKLGFRITEDENEPWILFWIDTGVSVERVLAMKPYTFINHFPGMHEICRKDCLARNLGRLSRSFPKDGNFFPRTWVLPLEWGDLKATHNSTRRRKPCYIVKPDHGCQGKGISLLSSPDDLLPMLKTLKGPSSLIVQSYLTRPCLIDSYKFDLRVYVLVTSVKPLRVFLYQDGLARFATEPYREPRDSNLDNVCMHLTNYAINKNSENFDHATEEGKGSKRSIRSVLQHLKETRGPAAVEKMWRRIGDVVVKTLLTIQPQLSRNMQACFPSSEGGRQSTTKPTTNNDPTTSDSPSTTEKPPPSPPPKSTIQPSQCFEILGFDIFIDHKLKPWVLEVNHSPSFTCDSPLDAEIKRGVIGDALHLLNIRAANPKRFYSNQKRKSKKRLLAFSTCPNGGRSASPTTAPAAAAATATRSPRTRDPFDIKPSEHSPKLPSPDSDSPTSSASHATTPVETDIPGARLTNLSDEANDALENYYLSYSPRELFKLEAFEDAHLGHYQRIYPPHEVVKLAHFLLLQNEAANIFSETISTKRRREFLENKKREEELKARKMANWRQRQRDKARSVPLLLSKSLSDDAVVTRPIERARSLTGLYAFESGAGLISIPQAPSSLSSTSVLNDTFYVGGLQHQHQQQAGSTATSDESLRNGAKQAAANHNKQTIKMNVESINDRFMSSLDVQQQQHKPSSMGSSSRASECVGLIKGRPKASPRTTSFGDSISTNPRTGITMLIPEIKRKAIAAATETIPTPDPREAFERYEFIQRMQTALEELQKTKHSAWVQNGGAAAAAARCKQQGRSRRIP